VNDWLICCLVSLLITPGTNGRHTTITNTSTDIADNAAITTTTNNNNNNNSYNTMAENVY